MELMLEGYESKERIGNGSFGKVWKAIRKSDGKLVAVKEIAFKQMRTSERDMLVNEVRILKHLKNDHIVRYYDKIVNQSKQILYIVMEYCAGGDLQSLIRDTRAHRSSISESQIWLTLTELALALKECHYGPQKILHRDIKPGNIFIDAQGHVKIGDFGLARPLKQDFAKTRVGTPYYMSPELTAGHPYNEKNDIWALGCVIYELAALRPPFDGLSEADLALKIESPHPRRISSHYSSSLWHCISSMLQKDPNLRPTVLQILQWRNVQNTQRLQSLYLEREEIHQKKKRLENKEKSLLKIQESIVTLEKQMPGAKISENQIMN